MVPDLISPTDLQEKQTIAIVKSLKDVMELLKKLKWNLGQKILNTSNLYLPVT